MSVWWWWWKWDVGKKQLWWKGKWAEKDGRIYMQISRVETWEPLNTFTSVMPVLQGYKTCVVSTTISRSTRHYWRPWRLLQKRSVHILTVDRSHYQQASLFLSCVNDGLAVLFTCTVPTIHTLQDTWKENNVLDILHVKYLKALHTTSPITPHPKPHFVSAGKVDQKKWSC